MIHHDTEPPEEDERIERLIGMLRGADGKARRVAADVLGRGNVLFWLTVGRPDEWPVVLHEGRGAGFEQYGESMTSFLAKLLTGKIVSKFFRRFSKNEAVFVPSKC